MGNADTTHLGPVQSYEYQYLNDYPITCERSTRPLNFLLSTEIARRRRIAIKLYALPGCGFALLTLHAHAVSSPPPDSAFTPKGAMATFPAVHRRSAPIPTDRRLMGDVAQHPIAMRRRKLAGACEAAHLYRDAADAYWREVGLR